MNITQEIKGNHASKEALINELMDMYSSELKRIAYFYVHDLPQCEDIVQEVFISCYKNIHRFRNDSSYKTWLIRITVNKCKDYKRKWNIRNLVYKPSVESLINKTNQEKTASQYLEEKEDAEAIISTINNFPSKYKEVLILYYYNDLTLKEISSVTKIKFNTVKTRYARGRELLKKELERRGYNYE
ncbi:sigma-70 family RNA polymerase sigma factor [Paraliobacillus zengyii]|uniref:sigma-70 family RNA polymerase sigma factor n=1 Tax=Paraliobacillus zengyii TaxID=2213194 RepID=UPI00130091F5|nr:sigma-70 family RNA polymerase sigma factor [Paraliobacillus zengyii]